MLSKRPLLLQLLKSTDCKVLPLKKLLVAIYFVALCIVTAQAQYIVDFEGSGETKAGYASGSVNLTGISWNMTEALIGTDSQDFKNGIRSARLRGYGTSAITMEADKENGIGTISFQYRSYGSDIQVPYLVEYSTNGGSSWVQAGSDFTGTSTIETFSTTVNILGNSRIRIRTVSSSGTANRRLNIDDITITDHILVSTNPEPSNHPTSFSCLTLSDDEIELNWIDAIGTQIPAGYLIKWSDISYADITNPIDGSTANGANSITVAQGVETAAILGLDPNTEYFFKIWPYTNAGANIDYKTDAPIQQTDCITDNGPCFTESFNNNNAPSGTYSSGWFVGDEGTTWNYSQARNPDASYQISGTSIGFSDNGTGGISTTWDQGIASLSYDTRTYFTGGNANNRVVEVWINGVLRDSFTLSSFGTVFTRTINNINTAGIVNVELRSTGSRHVVIDNVNWTCYEGCTTTHLVSSFLPESGPAGTLVTISGIGFTGATSASFNGISSPFIEVLDDNTLIAEVPPGAANGPVGITVTGCEALSGGDFTFIRTNGNCGASGGGGSFATDLFISEVFDASSGSLAYIEVFNGTALPVDLSSGNYAIRIETGPFIDYPMSGILPSGDTYILGIGTSSSSCPTLSIDNNLPSAPGFNGDDNIYLLKNGVVLDDVPNPDTGAGFSQVRNADVTAPSATYIPSQWTISNTENCDDLSVPPFVPNSNNINISAHPIDVGCGSATFSVSATSTNGSIDTYVWRYSAPGDPGWSLVSDLDGTNGLTTSAAGLSSITITGNTAILQDYQFYVDIDASGTPNCIRASNAAQFTYNTRTFYRTIGNGNWSNPSVWEMSNTEAGPYTAACQYPVSVNSGKATIRAGHNVVLNAFDYELNEVEIEPAAELSLDPNSELIINNGNPLGADLVVNGTLIDNGNGANGVDFTDDISTWEIGADGTLVKTGLSSAARYRNQYESGIANIPATANWIYRCNGTANLNFASSTNAISMHYPNLILENVSGGTYSSNINSGNVNLSDFTMVGDDPIIIKGNFDVGGTGTGNINFSNINNGFPVLVEGNLIVAAGSTLRNTGTNAPNAGLGFEVRGDLEIEGNLALISGSSAGEGQLILSGNTDQIGVGNESLIRVNELEVNITGGQFYTDFSIEVLRQAEFISGIYEMDDLAAIEPYFQFGASATTMGASNTSFVDGWVRKVGNTEFFFPLGDTDVNGNAFQQSLRIFGFTGTGTFAARYHAEQHPNAGPYYDGVSNTPDDNHEIGNCDYWELERLAGTGNPRFGVNYTNPDPAYCNTVDAPEFVRIARWNGLDWDQIPSAEAPPYIQLDQAIGAAVDSDYGDFALMTTNANDLNVLPITFISFDVRAVDGLVHTTWLTASETDNDYFTVERSKNSYDWEAVGRVDGAGNSHTTLSYAFADDAPYAGVSYYRLRQTDYDGTTTLSEVRSVEILQGNQFGIDKVYQGQEGLNVVYRSAAPYVVLEIYDMLGKLVHGELLENYGNGFATIQPNLARGAYLLKLSHGSDMDTEKFVY